MSATERCGWESVETVLADPDIWRLIEAQSAELGVLPPDPDLRHLLALEAAGMYRVWTVRVEGLLAGFIRFTVMPHPDHRNTLFAFDCGHYLDRRYRDMGRFLRLWRGAEAALVELGVKVIHGHDNPKRPLAPAFKRLGFVPAGSQYRKVVG